MRFDEYCRCDGLRLAQLVADREISAAEALEAAIARAEAINPRLNAIVVRMDSIARKRAIEPLTGPFAGVPFLEKDLGQEYAGVPCSYGSRGPKRTGFVPPVHAEITERWLNAGALIFGRTNTPEFGLQLVTEFRRMGSRPQSLEPGPDAGRFVRRIGRRRVGGNRAARRRQRPRGLDPGPGRSLWTVWLQAGTRPHTLGAGARRDDVRFGYQSCYFALRAR